MSVLSKSQIWDRINETNYAKKLVITPLLSEKQVDVASVDVRLGSSIIIPRRTFIESQDVTERKKIKLVERRLYDCMRLKYNSKFILHPRGLLLGVTFEYISLPYDIFATIASRSSWGRLGLVTATAAVAQPGFKGCLTLELVNLSESPITLYPGLRVGQLVFHKVSGVKPIIDHDVPNDQLYTGRYNCPTEAEFPSFFAKPSDDEMEFWGKNGDLVGAKKKVKNAGTD